MTPAALDGLFVREKFVHLVGGPITIRRPIACTKRAHHTCVDRARRPSAIVVLYILYCAGALQAL